MGIFYMLISVYLISLIIRLLVVIGLWCLWPGALSGVFVCKKEMNTLSLLCCCALFFGSLATLCLLYMLNNGRRARKWQVHTHASTTASTLEHGSKTAANAEQKAKKLQQGIFIPVQVFTCLSNLSKITPCLIAVIAYSEYDLIPIMARINCCLHGGVSIGIWS